MSSFEKNFQYRTKWAATSNIGFKGSSRWHDYDGFAESEEQVTDELLEGGCSDAIDQMLRDAGIDWDIEVRSV